MLRPEELIEARGPVSRSLFDHRTARLSLFAHY
jgi:hypothetical protein